MAYENQSKTLKEVQKYGPKFEKDIRSFLDWPTGRIQYYNGGRKELKYDLQVDACWPDVDNPEVFVSTTYCNPDKPGHSNENKLQLKLGELLLLKGQHPDIRAILIIGGTKEAWSPYVLEVFEYFYDETHGIWEADFDDNLEKIKANPMSVELKHQKLWEKISTDWSNVELYSGVPINSQLRFKTWQHICEVGYEGNLPDKISNEIFRHCMTAAYKKSVATRSRNGKEWYHYCNSNWSRLWESRSFFNPGEAAIELILNQNNIAHFGMLANDAEVPSLIHQLGGENVDNTKVSEDFVLFSNKYKLPIFIQSKSSGGGKKGHGKNIQNRTKEQLARSLFYRGYIDNTEVKVRKKDFIWIGVLDNNWGVTKKTPLKYIHMLQWAGYDYLISAESLVDGKLELDHANNPLINILDSLDCETNHKKLNKSWANWLSKR